MSQNLRISPGSSTCKKHEEFNLCQRSTRANSPPSPKGNKMLRNFTFDQRQAIWVWRGVGGVTKFCKKHENLLTQQGHHYFGQRNHQGVSKMQLFQKSLISFFSFFDLEASFFGLFQKFEKCGQPLAGAHQLQPTQGPLK